MAARHKSQETSSKGLSANTNKFAVHVNTQNTFHSVSFACKVCVSEFVCVHVFVCVDFAVVIFIDCRNQGFGRDKGL